MRHPLLALMLAAAVACQAAEIETITLADGRVLVGELTPKGLHGATVALVKPKATITISMDDVRERAPWHEPQVVVYAPGTGPVSEAPKPKPEPPAAVKVSRIAGLDEQIAVAEERAKAADVALRDLRGQRFRALMEEQERFIATGDLGTVAVSAKPGASAQESEAVRRAVELNFMLERLTRCRAAMRNSHLSESPPELGMDFWRSYTEFKHIPAPY